MPGCFRGVSKQWNLNPGDASREKRPRHARRTKLPRMIPARRPNSRTTSGRGDSRGRSAPGCLVKEHPTFLGLYALGYSLFAQQKIGESIRRSRNLSNSTGEMAEAHKFFGRDLMVIGRYDAAQTEFEQGTRYTRNPRRCILTWAKLFLSRITGAPREKIETNTPYRSLYVESLDGLGFAQEALAMGREAVASYEKAIAINEARKGKFRVGHVNLSAYYNRQSDYEKRSLTLRAAGSFEPKSDGAWFSRQKRGRARARLMDAVDALHRAISITPRASSYITSVHVYRRLGREEDSRRRWTSFVRLRRRQPIGRNAAKARHSLRQPSQPQSQRD